MSRLGRFFRTVAHLRAAQVLYRLWYPLKRRWWRATETNGDCLAYAAFFRATVPLFPGTDAFDNKTREFCLLNLTAQFPGKIDWDYAEHGRLWCYHLNYFRYLDNPALEVKVGLDLIEDYVQQGGKAGLEPYPTSLRILHWISFWARHGGASKNALRHLHRDAQRLAAFPEYHIGANHLLENGLALACAAIFFRDEKFWRKARAILDVELPSQILEDGGHYERSPAYHTLLLSHILIVAGLLAAQGDKANFLACLQSIAAKMLGWVEAMRVGNHLPHFGDSNRESCLDPDVLIKEAAAMGIVPIQQPLGASGYRRLDHGTLTLFFNCGASSPPWQPGHSHADPLAFQLFANGEPIISDPGCSTYEHAARRGKERATSSHSTLWMKGHDAAELWKIFRMGRRPRVTILEESTTRIRASHDGYRHLGFLHEREISLEGEDSIFINDVLSNNIKVGSSLFFDPGTHVEKRTEESLKTNHIMLTMHGYEDVHLQPAYYAAGFNHVLPTLIAQGFVLKHSHIKISPRSILNAD